MIAQNTDLPVDNYYFDKLNEEWLMHKRHCVQEFVMENGLGMLGVYLDTYGNDEYVGRKELNSKVNRIGAAFDADLFAGLDGMKQCTIVWTEPRNEIYYENVCTVITYASVDYHLVSDGSDHVMTEGFYIFPNTHSNDTTKVKQTSVLRGEKEWILTRKTAFRLELGDKIVMKNCDRSRVVVCNFHQNIV